MCYVTVIKYVSEMPQVLHVNLPSFYSNYDIAQWILLHTPKAAYMHLYQMDDT